ncbi:hypothetical protein HYDPIDRAFT_115341 [Hydnomerulius pinastri MD-312]|uniref:Uncharacterized protein n=1 Tax=Hydnomerulius pinastri MD-312 TaxID=994086 RepID=A0A0C9W5B5_9AGAM|nr:hypothetical protein HYDPIDRAFT_115341 [Hydnomerulius pinastri MD-312]
MHPSRISRQQLPPDNSISSRYWHNQSGRNKFMIASTAVVAATTLAYYWGYRDVDKRHSPERNAVKPGDKRR